MSVIDFNTDVIASDDSEHQTIKSIIVNNIDIKDFHDYCRTVYQIIYDGSRVYSEKERGIYISDYRISELHKMADKISKKFNILTGDLLDFVGEYYLKTATSSERESRIEMVTSNNPYLMTYYDYSKHPDWAALKDRIESI